MEMIDEFVPATFLPWPGFHIRCNLFVWHKDEPVRVPSFAVNLDKAAFFSVCSTYSFFTDVNSSQRSYCVKLCC